jgi:putative ABC transport system substrate-binding protein
VFAVRAPADFEGAFRPAVKARAEAVLINETSMSTAHRTRLAELAVRHRLPASGSWRFATEAGFLMSYGPDPDDLFRRAESLVGKILRGTKPADLPIEQPSRFELATDLKTAKALGLTIPASVRMPADQAVE